RDMGRVVLNIKNVIDEAPHSCGRPEVVPPPVRCGALEQQPLQLLQLVVGQGGGASDGLGVEAARRSRLVQPALDGDAVDAKNLGHGRGRLTLVDRSDGAFADMFPYSSSSWCSHENLLAIPTNLRRDRQPNPG